MASTGIIDTTCDLLARQHMHNSNKAVVSSLGVLSLLNLGSDVQRVHRMKEWIGDCDTVFIPCLRTNHWTLVILFTTTGFLKRTNRVLYVDSWKPDPSKKQ
jgi:hypothetical protein